MPVGLVFMKWDEIAGNEILAKFPEEIDLDDKMLIQIFETHDYSGTKGVISLMVGSLNSISYYSGTETNYCVILLLSLGDDPDDYEIGLIDLSHIILQNLENKAYLKMIPSLFQRVCLYPKFNYEQQLAMIYENEIKRSIINRLRVEGIISQSELMTRLKDVYIQEYNDLEPILSDLIQKEIIKISSVKGERSLLIFFLNDLVMFRVPPFKLIINPLERGIPKELVAIYQSECNKFFQDYEPLEEDNLKIVNLLIDQNVYDILKLLREKAIMKRDLDNLKESGLDNIDYVIKSLIDTQLIQIFNDSQGNEYYILITDFFVKTFLPEYIVNVIKTDFDQKIKSNQVLIKYLDLLEDAYVNL